MNSATNPATLTRRWILRRLALFAGAAPLLASDAVGDDAAQLPRIAYFSGDFPELANAFIDELRTLGFVDGKNIVVEKYLTRDGSDTNAIAREISGKPFRLIVAGALPFALMIRAANPQMPMVIATCPGMVSNGFAQSLEHPGGIYTGLDELPDGVTAKRLMLLKTAAPTVKNVALLSTTPGVGGHERQLNDAELRARELGIAVKPYRAATPAELNVALTTIVADRMEGLLNFQGGLSIARRQMIVDFAAEHRLPAIYQATMFANAGGLMAWAPDLVEQQREAARLTAQILRGAKPGDLPVKHPSKYFLTVHSGAAKKIGLTLPPALLAQADRVLS